ncbi:MAG: hypothetical protein Q8J88_01765 [Bacteroidales bacterium]|nr:hypothetical protein [Bacteroidales bacterium]
MKQITQPIRDITEELRHYLNMRLNFLSLMLSRRFALFTSFVLTAIILAALVGFVLIMLSFAFVFWYGKTVGAYHHGFLIMGLFYALVGLTVFFTRKQMFIDPIIRKMNEKISSPVDEDDPMPSPENLTELIHETELLKLKIMHSELIMQQKFDELGESLNPFNYIAGLIDKTLNISTFILPFAELLINWLRKKKAEDEGDNEDQSSSDS